LPVGLCLPDPIFGYLEVISCLRGPWRLRYLQSLVWRAIITNKPHVVLQVAVDPMETIDGSPAESTVALPRAQRRSYFREVPWRWSDVLIAFIPIIVDRLRRFLPYAGPPWFRFALYLLSFVWMLVYPLFVGRRRLGSWPRLPAPRVLFIETIFALPAAVAIFTTFILIPPCLLWLFGETEIPPNPFEPIIRSPARFEVLSFMILAILFGPVAEEVFFRGLLYNTVRQKLHVIMAMPLQAVAFGFYHPFGVVFSSAIAVGAMGLAAIYEWRKTLLTPILTHALINVIGLSLMTLGFTADANTPRLGIYGTAHERGCLVTEVAPGSPAETAGLQAGDVVVAVEGKPVADIPSIFRIIRKKHVGDPVVVDFLRAGKTHRGEAVLNVLRR
jgi:membrane protease YdiL (CAAX protease family)